MWKEIVYYIVINKIFEGYLVYYLRKRLEMMWTTNDEAKKISALQGHHHRHPDSEVNFLIFIISQTPGKDVRAFKHIQKYFLNGTKKNTLLKFVVFE